MTREVWCLFMIVILPIFCDASRILVVFPFPSKSHSILGEGYVKLLLEAGHEVTYITPFPKENQNLYQIDVSDNIKEFRDNIMDIKAILDKTESPNNPATFLQMLLNLDNSTFNNENIKKLITDPNQKFDLIIIEWMFSEIYAGLAAVFDCPYIWFSTVDPHWIVLKLIDEALHPAYNSAAISSNIPPFTFIQRVQELFGQIFFSFILRLFFTNHERTQYENIFAPIMASKGKPLPSYDEMRYNSSLMLGNSHASLGQPTRLPQNYKEIAGYHIDPKVKPLPEDLQRIMDNAKNGVIYFSMGSNLKSKDYPDKVKLALLKMFAELKNTVIWKFEEVLPDVPKNVHILKWAPQQSILAHPNCVLFITHGGFLSTTETVHFGVPIIGIPVFADQNNNVERAVIKGFAKKVELSYEMAGDLKVAIEDVLSNPRYREKVQELSLIYHDRPASPGAELVHWVEHVIRTRGALHLRSPALHVPWYQKMYLDLLALILVVLYGVKYCVRRLCCSSKTNINKKKTN